MASPFTALAGAALPAFVPVYSAFAAAYLLSYLFRTVNAVISPELTRELGLDASSLGFLTSAYFLAFGLMQIPVGMLLDRYGPRRVEPVLLAIAAAGALLFGLADGLPGLTLGRAIIGGGVSACLMAPLKGIAMWYPPERHASLSGWMMVAGGLGALAATTPLEYALRFTNWRTIFVGLAAVTLVGGAVDRMARSRHAAAGCTRRTSARSSAACARCSRTRGSGGSRRSPASAWARSSRCRDCGRCRG